jgi:hypothetical protein
MQKKGFQRTIANIENHHARSSSLLRLGFFQTNCAALFVKGEHVGLGVIAAGDAGTSPIKESHMGAIAHANRKPQALTALFVRNGTGSVEVAGQLVRMGCCA